MNARSGNDLALVRNAARPTHGHAIGFAEPVRLHSLLRGDRVVPVVHAIVVQEGRGGEHGEATSVPRGTCFEVD